MIYVLAKSVIRELCRKSRDPYQNEKGKKISTPEMRFFATTPQNLLQKKTFLSFIRPSCCFSFEVNQTYLFSDVFSSLDHAYQVKTKSRKERNRVKKSHSRSTNVGLFTLTRSLVSKKLPRPRSLLL